MLTRWLQGALWAATSLGKSSLHGCCLGFDFSHSLLFLKLVGRDTTLSLEGARVLLGRGEGLVRLLAGLKGQGWWLLLSHVFIQHTYRGWLLPWGRSVELSELVRLSHEEPTSAAVSPDRTLVVVVALRLDC